jgi:hypothetical protein
VVAFYLEALADQAALVEEPATDAPPDTATTITFEGRWTGFISVGRTAESTVLAVQLFSEPVPSD